MGRANAGALSTAARDRLLSLLGFVAIWWAGSYLSANPMMLPAPQRVALFAWHDCITGALPAAFAATLARVAVAFILAMLSKGSVAVRSMLASQ